MSGARTNLSKPAFQGVILATIDSEGGRLEAMSRCRTCKPSKVIGAMAPTLSMRADTDCELRTNIGNKPTGSEHAERQSPDKCDAVPVRRKQRQKRDDAGSVGTGL